MTRPRDSADRISNDSSVRDRSRGRLAGSILPGLAMQPPAWASCPSPSGGARSTPMPFAKRATAQISAVDTAFLLIVSFLLVMLQPRDPPERFRQSLVQFRWVVGKPV